MENNFLQKSILILLPKFLPSIIDLKVFPFSINLDFSHAIVKIKLQGCYYYLQIHIEHKHFFNSANKLDYNTTNIFNKEKQRFDDISTTHSKEIDIKKLSFQIDALISNKILFENSSLLIIDSYIIHLIHKKFSNTCHTYKELIDCIEHTQLLPLYNDLKNTNTQRIT